MQKREIVAAATVKHNALDIVDDKRKVSINCQFRDGDNNFVGSDNLNFTMDPEEYERFLKQMQIDNLNGKTPLIVTILRPEGKLLDKWNEDNVGDDPQEPLPEE